MVDVMLLWWWLGINYTMRTKLGVQVFEGVSGTIYRQTYQIILALKYPGRDVPYSANRDERRGIVNVWKDRRVVIERQEDQAIIVRRQNRSPDRDKRANDGSEDDDEDSDRPLGVVGVISVATSLI